MSASQLETLLAIYVIVGVIYLGYHAYLIASTAVGAEHRMRLFYRQLYNPFWRTLEQDLLRSQTAEFRAYVSKIERIKYFFVAGAILLGVSSNILSYSSKTLRLDMIDGIMIYLAIGVAYFLRQAYVILKMPNSAIELRLFFRMMFNPFWRVFEREALASQSADFKSYILRLEVIKFCHLFGAILLIVASMR